MPGSDPVPGAADGGGFVQVPPPPPGAAAPGGPHDGPTMGGQLHPAAIGVWSATQIGALVVVFLLNPGFVLAALPLVAVLVTTSAVRYARFRWQLVEGTLVIEQGLVQRRRRVIPIERVQSVDLVRRLSHRLFGVVGVHVEAIGAGDTEGQLDALAPAVAHRLREALLAGRAAARGDDAGAVLAAEPAGAGHGVLVRLGPRELLLAGVTEANATLLAAAGGLAWQLLGERFDEVLRRAQDLLGTPTVVAAVALALLGSIGLLIAAQFVLYWNFTLRRSGSELQVRRGLLEQRFDTIPLRRLQALRLEENLPRRLLGFAAVKADVAGKPGGGSGGTDTLLPFGRVDEARALVAEILGDEAARTVVLQPMPRRARGRRQVRAILAVSVVTVATTLVWESAGLLALLLVVPGLAAAHSSYRALGHAELPGLVVVRAGWWVRRTAFVPESRLQTLALRASVLQRRRRLATLELHIARSPGVWSGPRMIDLDRDTGRDLVQDLAPLMARRAGVT